MFEWLSTEGASLKHHVPGETNYLTQFKGRDEGGAPRPFPNNRTFISETVLSEDLRNEVYVQVVEQNKSLRAVSVELGIDMKRIAAVVRLVELERRHRAQVCDLDHPPSAIPYSSLSSDAYDETTKNRLVLKTRAYGLTG